MSARYPHLWPARMEITFADDRRIGAEVDEVDWSPRRPATWPQIADKFRAMAAPLIGSASAEEIIRMTERFEDLEDVNRVMSQLGPAA